MSLIHIQDDECLTISQLAKILNVHVVTIRNWERDGNSPIPVHRTQGNQRRYLGKDIKQYLGLKSQQNPHITTPIRKPFYMPECHLTTKRMI